MFKKSLVAAVSAALLVVPIASAGFVLGGKTLASGGVVISS